MKGFGQGETAGISGVLSKKIVKLKKIHLISGFFRDQLMTIGDYQKKTVKYQDLSKKNS